MEPPICIIEENGRFRQAPPAIRVERMFEQLDMQLKPLRARLSKNKTWPDFIICLLPNKDSEIYGQAHCVASTSFMLISIKVLMNQTMNYFFAHI